MARSNLNNEQLDDAKRLKSLWSARKDDLSLTQSFVAQSLGVAQATINGYLNGNWPLNVNVAVRFAQSLQCRVEDFSPSLQREIDYIASFSSSAAAATSALLDALKGSQQQRWPFSSITAERISSLSPADRLKFEGAMEMLLLQWQK